MLKRVLLGVCLAVFISFIEPANGEVYSIILHGKVVMPDGKPPPFSVGIERVCSDGYGSKPGPLTNKKGEFIWRMDVDPMRTRACHIQATHTGYFSSSVDISALYGYLDRTFYLEPIVLMSQSDDPYAIIIPEKDVPLRARSAWKKAMKALENGNRSEAIEQFQIGVQKSSKFTLGWHALGVLLEFNNIWKEAREAYEHAIESDKKFLPPHMTLTRLCIKTKDWESAVKAADALIKVDKKCSYPDVHLHRAVALYELKDLNRAAESAKEALRLDPIHRTPRTEYILGRILEAQGDIEGAREHMLKYLELDKKAIDSERIRRHLQNLGNPQSAEEVTDLEYL